MARKPMVRPGLAKADPRPGSRDPGRDGVSVEVVPVQGRRLMTLGPDHSVWMSDDPSLLAKWARSGSIVRLRPPPNTPPERLEAVRAALQVQGAARVRIEVQRPATVPQEALVRRSQPRSTARQVVNEMVAEANVDDREALAVVVGRLLDEEGV